MAEGQEPDTVSWTNRGQGKTHLPVPAVACVSGLNTHLSTFCVDRFPSPDHCL